MLRIDFISIFPEMILSALGYSIPHRAQTFGLVEYHAINPRDYTQDKHRKVDDTPYGGGAGMVMKPEPIARAIESLLLPPYSEIVFTDPTGQLFNQDAAKELAQVERIVFVCGRYEGIDERVRLKYATRTYSIGDFVLSGGELAALVMADAVVRLIPGVLGKTESLVQDSFNEGILSAPQYTKPPVWENMPIPEVLLSGHHQNIQKWKRQQALLRTRQYRPDLFEKLALSEEDKKLLESL
jgi:tRNA (guanine37-N1)-methyltransferase